MQEHRHNQIDKAHKISLQNMLLKGIGALLFVIAFYGITAAQTTYTFTGAEDDRYENPTNWSPVYPGTVIAEDAVVMIEGDAYTLETLEIRGKVHVTVGSVLEVEENHILVVTGATLVNDGDIYAASIRNTGMLNNNFSATVSLTEDFVAYTGSMTNNLMSAEMIIDGELRNAGAFNNYSLCVVNGEQVTLASR